MGVANQEVWFIINMISGVKSNLIKEKLLIEISKSENAEVFKTEYAGHANLIAQNAVKLNIAKVVAIGGDGTINEVGSALRGSNVQLGIIPMGSGNGLARHLKIPMDVNLALRKVYTGSVLEIDTCTINEIPFLCTAGVGFDAYVADKFAKKTTRGFFTYLVVAIQSFFKFPIENINIIFNNAEISTRPLAITFANASQYGNNAIVAPKSEINDGLIDMVILKPFSVFNAFVVGFRLFNNSFHKSKFVNTEIGTQFEVGTKNNILIHYDGEPKQLNTNRIIVKIHPDKLKVII